MTPLTRGVFWAKRFKRHAESLGNAAHFLKLRQKYRDFTMIPTRAYVSNLLVTSAYAQVPGCVVECGVWRGGMSAGMAEALGPDRRYYLFDSFEGLPEAKPIDGPAALQWQTDKNGATYHDNCRAEQEFAERAMRMSGARDYQLIKGWFDQTLPNFVPEQPIAILRIDADWYDSVMCCLVHLTRHLAPGAIVILDDYWTWDGCSKATHRFLADRDATARLATPYEGVCVIQGLA
jgi:O-methyltransferase